MQLNIIQLTDKELEIIYMALGELPLKVSGPLFSNIQQQISTPKPVKEKA